MDTLDRLTEAEQLDAAMHHFLPEMIDAGVVREDRTFHLEMHTAEGVASIDMTDRVRQAVTAVRHRRSVERRRTRGYRPALMRRPRSRGAGRPKAAPTRRSSPGGGRRDGPPDDDGSGSSEPPPVGRRTFYTYAVLTAKQRGASWSS